MNRICNILCRSLLLMSVALVGVSTVPVAYAADEKKLTKEEKEARLKYKDKKVRQRKALGRACQKKISKWGEFVESKDWAGAEQMLTQSLARACDTSFEKATVFNQLGYVYYALDRVDDSIDYYRKMTREEDADLKQKIRARYVVAQLMMSKERYKEAAQELELWMSEATIVDRGGRVLLAEAYARIDRKNDALKLVNDVIEETLRSDLIPKERWLVLKWSLMYEKQQFKELVGVSYLLLTHYPKVKYWKQLSAIYGQLSNDQQELLALEITYLLKGLNKEKQFLALAYQFLAVDMPFQAGQVLEKAMEAEQVERTEKNLALLGSAYQRAQEYQKASPVLEEAGKLASDGNTYSRLASVYLNLNENEKALVASRNALKKGGLKREDLAWMNRGNAEQALHCYKDAARSFTRAAKFEKTAQSAASWRKYVEKEGSRRAKLIASGAKLSRCKRV